MKGGSEPQVHNMAHRSRSLLHFPPVATGVLILAQREDVGSGVGDIFNTDCQSGWRGERLGAGKADK